MKNFYTCLPKSAFHHYVDTTPCLDIFEWLGYLRPEWQLHKAPQSVVLDIVNEAIEEYEQFTKLYPLSVPKAAPESLNLGDSIDRCWLFGEVIPSLEEHGVYYCDSEGYDQGDTDEEGRFRLALQTSVGILARALKQTA